MPQGRCCDCVTLATACGSIVVLPVGGGGRQSVIVPIVLPLNVFALLTQLNVCCHCHRCHPQVVQHCLQAICRGSGEDNNGPLSSVLLWIGGVIMPQQLQPPSHPNPSPTSNHHHLCHCCSWHHHFHCHFCRQVGCHVAQPQFVRLRSNSVEKCCHLK